MKRKGSKMASKRPAKTPTSRRGFRVLSLSSYGATIMEDLGQVLKLRHCPRLRALPGNMSALVNLMHLELEPSDHSNELVDSIQDPGKLTSLRELNVKGVKAKELGDMSMLRRLEIRNLEEVTGKEEAAQARLDAKKYLETLRLGWRDDVRSADHHPSSLDDHQTLEEEEEGVLEGLQPVSSIRGLIIYKYGGVRSPRWLEDPAWVSSSFLEKVELTGCKNWEVLPPLGQLRGLKELKISGMSSVRRIGPLFFLGGCYPPGQGGGGGGGFETLVGFPSLESLEFTDMPEWEEWEAPHHHGGDDEEVGQRQQQQVEFLPLPRLSSLSITGCRELTSLPVRALAHLTSLKRLNIRNCPKLSSSSSSLPSVSTADEASIPWSMEEVGIYGSGDMVEHFLLASILPKLTRLSALCVSVGSSSTAQLLLNGILQNRPVTATLKTLQIGRDHHHDQQHQACSSSSNYIPSLLVPPASPLPLQMEKVAVGQTNNIRDHLTSLRSLEIKDCSDLLQLSGLPSSLERLCIWKDTHLDDRILATYLEGLCRLTYLRIDGCPHMTSLPTAEVLCQLTALELLIIQDCRELMSWGGGVHNLIALHELIIVECPKLQWLPSVDLPKSLWNVSINGSFIPIRR